MSKVDAQREIYPNIISNQRLAFKPTVNKLQSSNITFNIYNLKSHTNNE